MKTILTGPPLADYGERTLNALFFSAVRRFADLPALGGAASGARLTFAEVEARVAGVARLLRQRGVEAGDRVAILSENRPEWAIADYAALSLGAVTVPIYPSLPAGQVAEILDDSAPKVVFVSDAGQARKLGDAAIHPPAGIVSFDPVAESATAAADDAGWPAAPIVALGTLLSPQPGQDAASAGAWLDAWRERAAAVASDELATLIYTSGTTGTPKGVMLTHGNLAAMVAATRQHGSLDVAPGEVVLSILPLSHVFERAADYYFFGQGVTIVYAESMQTVPRDILAVRPHHLIAVPRLFEKIHAAAVGTPGLKGRIARWAADAAVEWVRETSRGGSATAGLRARHAIADRLVYAKLRARLGGRLRTFISGGAPLEPRVGALFLAAGVPVYEGYGLTETSPVISANRPGAVRLGSAGVPYPGVEVRLGAQDEIQVRGPGVTPGYWRRPDATAAAFTDDGWFRTGDVGAVEDGVLLVVDRLKELIVTAGGKNVAPQPLEARVVASPLISQAVLVGDRRPYLVMLVVPEIDALDEALRESPDADSLGWLREVEKRIAAEVAARLHGAGRVEQPKRIAVLSEQFTVDNELLTPTLKVRRRAVERAYAALLDRLYAGSTGVNVPWREG